MNHTQCLFLIHYRSLSRMFTKLLFGFLATIFPVVISAEPEPAQVIEISVNVPTVMVTPHHTDHFISLQLPSLIYDLTLTTFCDKNWQPISVSVSIADSGKSFNARQLQGTAILKTQLQIPAMQIAPLPVEQFCIKNKQEKLQPGNTNNNETPSGSNRNKITISSVLSAQASLLCATETEQSITYVTKSLDVTLECGKNE